MIFFALRYEAASLDSGAPFSEFISPGFVGHDNNTSFEIKKLWSIFGGRVVGVLLVCEVG